MLPVHYLMYPYQEPTEKMLQMPTAGTGQGWHFSKYAQVQGCAKWTSYYQQPTEQFPCARCFICIMFLKPLNHPMYQVQLIILIFEKNKLRLERVLEP